MFFLAGNFPGDARFSVHARVVAPPRFSTLPADPNDVELAGPPAWPTSLVAARELYASNRLPETPRHRSFYRQPGSLARAP